MGIAPALMESSILLVLTNVGLLERIDDNKISLLSSEFMEAVELIEMERRSLERGSSFWISAVF